MTKEEKLERFQKLLQELLYYKDKTVPDDLIHINKYTVIVIYEELYETSGV
jgi:hypothetical protein